MTYLDSRALVREVREISAADCRDVMRRQFEDGGWPPEDIDDLLDADEGSAWWAF